MRRTIWFGLLAAALAVSLGTTGCRRRPKTGAGIGDDMIGPDAGIGAMGEHGLAYRPEGGLDIITSVSFSPVYFEYDSAQVSDSQRAGIEAVADYARKNARVGVLVEGNCDERVSADYNLSLGERRALAVRAYLIGLGIDGGLIQTKSNGEEKPAALGHDEDAWRQNRRAEFVLFRQ